VAKRGGEARWRSAVAKRGGGAGTETRPYRIGCVSNAFASGSRSLSESAFDQSARVRSMDHLDRSGLQQLAYLADDVLGRHYRPFLPAW